MIEEALKTRLGSHAGLVALIAQRAYPVLLPQSPVYPALTYSRVSAQRDSVMGADSGLTRARFNVTSWDTTYAGVKAVSEQVRAALQRYRATVGGIEIQDIFILNDTDLFDDATRIHYVASDFEVIFREA